MAAHSRGQACAKMSICHDESQNEQPLPLPDSILEHLRFLPSCKADLAFWQPTLRALHQFEDVPKSLKGKAYHD